MAREKVLFLVLHNTANIDTIFVGSGLAKIIFFAVSALCVLNLWMMALHFLPRIT